MTDLSTFLDVFELDEGSEPLVAGAQPRVQGTAGEAVLAMIGGRSFNLGTFRTFTSEDAVQWNATIGGIFPALRGAIFCVGFAWNGRIIAETLLDRGDIERGVTIVDPGTADCLNAPVDIVTFLNDVLCDGAEDVLEAATYFEWLNSGESPVGHDECVGYDVPLFLGGEASFDNMSISDLGVYWNVSGELIRAYLDGEDGDAVSVEE